MKFIINEMSREQEIALKTFLDKGDYAWESKFKLPEEKKFIVEADDMSREQEVALEQFLEKDWSYKWHCEFRPDEE